MKKVHFAAAFLFDRNFLSNKKVLRAESHCGGMELCRKCDLPQAENPAKAGFFLNCNQVLDTDGTGKQELYR